MAEPRYETTPFRAIPALFAGAATGTVIIVLALSLSVAMVKPGAFSLPWQVFNMSFMLAPFVFFVLGTAALFVAGPCLWVLHGMGRRGRLDIMAVWGLVFAAAGLVPPIAAVALQGLGDPWRFLAMGLAGTISGLIFWRIAYRPESSVWPADEPT